MSKISKQTLHFPHARPELLRRGQHAAQAIAAAVIAGAVRRTLRPALGLYFQGSPEIQLETNLAVYRELNEPNAAEQVVDKLQFEHVLQQLGYRAPRSICADPEKDTLEALTKQVHELDRSAPQRFCKPFYSSKGRGIYLADSPAAAARYALAQPHLTLIQTMETPAEDWRYILHRDPAQAAHGQPPLWRIAYHKVRPQVVGDGRHTVRQLLEVDSSIPAKAKQRCLKYFPGNLQDVPIKGQPIDLVQTGNISVGSYGTLPSRAALDYVDRFMLELLSDLEKHLGTTFGTFCVDIGLLDTSVFNAPYNDAAMRRSVTFYEFQVPFGLSGYLDTLPASTWQKRRLRSLLTLSALRSGDIVRRPLPARRS